MTVLSTGVRPLDKVPLVDDAERNSSVPPPPPPARPTCDPKLLESGEARQPPPPPPAKYRKFGHWWSVSNCSVLCCAIKAVLVLLAFSLMFWLSGGAFCYKRATNSQQQQSDQTVAAAADVKSYTSYVADESDVLPARPSAIVPADDGGGGGGGGDYDDWTGKRVFPDPDLEAIERVLASNNAMSNMAHVLNEDFAVGHPDGDGGKAVVTKSARFVHDFSANVTGIVDDEAQQCFVMPLMREYIAQPVSLFDLLFKMSSGYYSRGVKQVIGDMRVIKPAIKDLAEYGLFISKDCADYSTYRMERAAAATTAAAV